MPAKITSPLASDDSQFWQSVEAKTPNPSLPVECLKRPPTGLRLRGVRYMILVLGTLYLSLILGCVICFSPALTVMMNVNSSASFNSSESEDSNNPWNWDVPLADRRFPFTNMEKSLLLAGTFGACLFQILPVGYSMQLFGAWRTQLAIGFSVSMATGLIPFAASLNFYALLIVRMVLGLAITNLFPVVGCICNAWAPQAERGTFLALLSGYVQLAIIISMPLSGFLCDKFGWPSVFFVHSILGLLLTALWAFFYKDDPRKHRWITEEELALILAGKGDQSADKANNKKPPYGRILSTSQIWAIFCAVAGNFLVVQFSNTFLPMFLVTAMHFSNSDTGMISALPLIIQFGAKWLTGIATDHLPKVTDIIKVRFCNSTAFCGAAFFFLLASLFPPETFTPWPAVACLVFCIGILGLNSGGYPKSAVLVAAQYTPTVMAGVQTMLCATIFIGSFIVPAMTSNGGQFWEYRRVFYLYAAALLVSNLVFVLFGKASPAKWTRMEKEEMEKTRF